MELTLKNICKIKEATIKLEGITVIAGENNTGKSTVGKVLFCIFNSFFKYEEQIYEFRKNNIIDQLQRARMIMNMRKDISRDYFEKFEKIAEELIGLNKNQSIPINESVSDILHDFLGDFDENIIEQTNIVVNRIIRSLEVSDNAIFERVLTDKLHSEFYSQINNIYDKDAIGEIHLFIKDNEILVVVNDNNINKIENKISLNTEVTYIDDPFVLDSGRIFMSSNNNYVNLNHKDDLRNKIFGKRKSIDLIEEIIVSEKLKDILNLIESVCDGEMVGVRRENSFKSNNSDKMLNIRNISTGLKTFIIIQTLLKNGTLEENGTIILDEPEIHLHPEWQLVFAEIIVLLYKEFNMHILLTTHSPYFLQAIEVYAAKHKIADKCKYYLAENDGELSKISDVSDNIESIYSLLLTPLQKLENERYSDD